MKTFVFVGILPMMMANATVMSYIATNHMLRPLVDSDDPLDNTLSLRTHWLVDALHWRFSHHVEHHLFPAMSSAKHRWFEAG